MRVMGPLALHYYFPEQVELYARLERLGERYFTDIDFVAYSKAGGKLEGFMEKLGYDCDVNTLMMTGKTRQIYYGGAVPMIDVFLDKLDYCHEVSFRGRLEFDDYCISLTDITLQKLQIWEINDKDLKDLEFLFTFADVGDDEVKKINRTYISKRLADDWGFWYTATTNFGRVKTHVDGVNVLDDSPEGARQAALRRVPGTHRGGAQDQGLAETGQEGHRQDLVQHELLRLVGLNSPCCPCPDGARVLSGTRAPFRPPYRSLHRRRAQGRGSAQASLCLLDPTCPGGARRGSRHGFVCVIEVLQQVERVPFVFARALGLVEDVLLCVAAADRPGPLVAHPGSLVIGDDTGTP